MKRKSLTVLGKSLMPEVLPDPSARAAPGGPRDRVRARLRQLKEHATAVAAAASLSACGAETHSADAGSANGGDGAVAGGGASGTGAGGTSAGSGGRGMTVTGGRGTSGSGGGGYAVVDPMPEPYVCSQLPGSGFERTQVMWNGDAIEIQAQLTTSLAWSAASLDSVATPAGIVGQVVSAQPIAARLSRGTSAPWPKSLDIYLRLVCQDASAVVHFDLGLRLDTSSMTATGAIRWTEISDADAGL